MEKVAVRWNGGRDDPDEINQFGHTFPKGEWVTLFYDKDNKDQMLRLGKFRGNPVFEVRGEEQPVASSATLSAEPVSPEPARPPATTYRVQGNNKTGFVVVDDKGKVIEGDKPPYKTAQDAQVVADALNAPK